MTSELWKVKLRGVKHFIVYSGQMITKITITIDTIELLFMACITIKSTPDVFMNCIPTYRVAPDPI